MEETRKGKRRVKKIRKIDKAGGRARKKGRWLALEEERGRGDKKPKRNRSH